MNIENMVADELQCMFLEREAMWSKGRGVK